MISGILLFAFILLVAIIAGRILARLLEHKHLRTEHRPSPGNLKSQIAEVLYNIGLLEPPAKPASGAAGSSKIAGADKLRKIIPILLGLGLILMPYFENRVVEVIAYALIIAATLLGLLRGEVSAGSKWVWIPLAVIIISGIIFSESSAGLLLVWMFGVYLVSHRFGAEATRYFGLATVVACVGLIVYSITHDFARTGGLFSPGNYNIATAAILTGFLMWNSKYKWLVSALVVVALFFTGADEAILATAVLVVTLLLRRDWSKKLLLPIAALAVTLAVCTPLGITYKIWTTETRIEASVSALETQEQSLFSAVFGSRWDAYKKASGDLRISGHGYNPFDDRMTTIHNLPLRVAYELGIIAGIAWLAVIVFAIKSSRAKYALVVIGILSLVDHMFWTQIPAYFWVALGSAPLMAPDLIFRSPAFCRQKGKDN